MATLGFVGVGRMGGPMASRLLDAGHSLVIFDTNAAVMKPLADRGATIARVAGGRGVEGGGRVPEPADAAGVCRRWRSTACCTGTTVKTLIDLSTTGPSVAKVVAKAAAEKGVAWVDSPVSGGIGAPPRARSP